MMRRFIFRELMVLLLAVSPVLFPALLLWAEGRVTRSDLADMYAHICHAVVRGFL